jgi:hypothetical protein
VAEQLDWEIVAEGVLLPVQAQAGARRNGVTGVRQGRLIVAVTQPPEKGKANEAIISVLADALGVKRRQIALVSGETNPKKRFLISHVELSDLSARIDEILE